MPFELAQLTGVGGTGLQRAAKKAVAGATGAGGFAGQLESLVEGVEEASTEANAAVTNMLDKSGDVHDAMIALQRAEMTLQLTVQIRNKLVTAYNDIMRMPI
jgi:flagellar hook-basal body complex protein FliE